MAPMNPKRMERQAKRASKLLKAIGNERRLMILSHLMAGEKSVGTLEKLIGLSQSALSQHLARLRRDKYVKTRREAQTIYYSLAGTEVETILSTLYSLYVDKGRSGRR